MLTDKDLDNLQWAKNFMDNYERKLHGRKNSSSTTGMERDSGMERKEPRN